MKVETEGHTTIIKSTKGDVVAFLMKLTHEYKTFHKKNIIVDLTLYDQLTTKEVNSFLPLSRIHKEAKKSFVIVANADYNKASAKLVLVPSLQEAHDMIEMDEIERDLGF